MPTWTTAFTAPPELTGLTVTADPDTSSVVLAWTASAIAAAEFHRYYVYRREVASGAFVRAGEVDAQALPTFIDIAAPHGIAAEYYVTVSNGWAESAPSDTAAAVLDLLYWIVHPDDPSLRFAVPHVSGYRESVNDGGQEFRALGRRAAVVVSAEALVPSGQFSSLLLPDEREVYYLLRRLLDVTPWVYLKNPAGDVHKVKVRVSDKDHGQAGVQQVAVTWTGVAV